MKKKKAKKKTPKDLDDIAAGAKAPYPLSCGMCIYCGNVGATLIYAIMCKCNKCGGVYGTS